MVRFVFFLLLLPIPLLPAQETVPQAVKLIEARNFDDARDMLGRIVERNDTDGEAHFQLGRILFEHFHDLDAAEEHLERALQLADGRADYHFMLGRVYGAIAQDGGVFTGMKYAGKVKSEFLRAVELDPDNRDYRTGLMRYYYRAPAMVGGGVSKAREQAGAILRLDAYEGHLAFAEIATHEKNFQEAETEYKAAIAASPAKPLAYFRLGYVYLGQKRIDESISEFRKYVKYAPDDPNSHDSLGEALLERGSIDEALHSYRKAFALNSRFPSSLYGMALCYDRKGAKAEALEYYQKFLSLDPGGKSAETAQKRVEEIKD